MPEIDYDWACRACGAANAAAAGKCAACGCPAVSSAVEIERFARGETGPQTVTLREARSARRKLGLVFLGLYSLLFTLLFINVVSSGGGEAGMILLFATLPWPWFGALLLGDIGAMLGVVAGLVLNGVIAFALGWGISWLFNRSKVS